VGAIDKQTLSMRIGKPENLNYAKQTQFPEYPNEHNYYINKGLWKNPIGNLVKTNPIQTQFKPNFTQNKPNSNPIQTQNKPNFTYSAELPTRSAILCSSINRLNSMARRPLSADILPPHYFNERLVQSFNKTR
jgi:hypothetical protein